MPVSLRSEMILLDQVESHVYIIPPGSVAMGIDVDSRMISLYAL
jgi:hypothetical protein